jgi:hypothetical protein
VQEEADKLTDWFGLSERETNWIRTAKAGNDEDGYSEALLGIDEEGWFPLRVRASEFEVETLDSSSIKPGHSMSGHSAHATGVVTGEHTTHLDSEKS